ncbi:MAG TPA: ATP synthase F0 subunit C [Candidatus Faecalibacterium intestinipullorum]|nr:ATP synthase F0 subunit C [Candidatus Faecalibacterium intestinipullorum]
MTLTVALAAPAFATEPATTAPATTQSAEAETEAEPAEATEASSTAAKAYASALAVGLAAAGGAISMGMLGAKSSESIARQPESEGKIRTSMMLTLVFIETAIIYALLAAILIIFVL